jgi:hypothetical protein
LDEFRPWRIPSADPGARALDQSTVTRRVHSKRRAAAEAALRHPDSWLFLHRSELVYVWAVAVVAILLVPSWPVGFETAAPYVSTVPISLAIRAMRDPPTEAPFDQ